MRIIHENIGRASSGRKATSNSKKAIDNRIYRMREKGLTFGKTLIIGSLTFVEHQDSIYSDLVGGPTLYAYWGGEKLTEAQIRERVK